MNSILILIFYSFFLLISDINCSNQTTDPIQNSGPIGDPSDPDDPVDPDPDPDPTDGDGDNDLGQSIDDSMEFMGDPEKKYSLYIPSKYSESQPNDMVLAFHPFHNNWGNSKTWRDILKHFAELNDLILVVPDGGPDLRIDDHVDLQFTTFLIDYVEGQYNINTDQKFILGFSMGGRATYNYGLDNVTEFKGFIVIGAFVDNITQTRLNNAQDKPFYVIHGDADLIAQVDVAFTPILDLLIANGANVNSLLLNNVGHTIQFLNRDQILTDAFLWVDSQ